LRSSRVKRKKKGPKPFIDESVLEEKYDESDDEAEGSY
jgi:hypothetical protein